MKTIIESPSPNWSPTTHEKSGVMIHITAGRMPWTLEWLRSPRSMASYHYLITQKGDVHRLVSRRNRAWSAGRFNEPSPRAKKFLKKKKTGGYVKPGAYMIQVGFEALEGQNFSEKQFESAVKLFERFPFDVTEKNFLIHKDTARDKVDIETERIEILKRLEKKDNGCEIVLNDMSELRAKVLGNGKIQLWRDETK